MSARSLTRLPHARKSVVPEVQLAVLVVPPVQLGGNFGTQEFFAGTPNDNDEAGGTPGGSTAPVLVP